jgi:hypothetical protein
MHGGIAERSKGRRRRRKKVSQEIPILYENFTKVGLEQEWTMITKAKQSK